MKSFSVGLALMVALLMTALLSSAAQAQVIYEIAGQSNSGRRGSTAIPSSTAPAQVIYEIAGQQNSSCQVGSHGDRYPQSRPPYRYERRGNDTLVFLGGILVGVLLDKVVNQTTNVPRPQPCPQSQQTCEPECGDQSVIIQQQPPSTQPVVVNQNTTVVVVDGVATATTSPPPRPTRGITGAVTLAPWGMNIVVPANKPVNVGTQIWFVRSGQIVGKFLVKAINGRTVMLEYISGTKPADGDGFAIVN